MTACATCNHDDSCVVRFGAWLSAYIVSSPIEVLSARPFTGFHFLVHTCIQVRVLPCPEGIGDPLFLIQDPVAIPADASSCAPLVATVGAAQAYVVGRAGIAAVQYTAGSHDIWPDFVAVGDYDAALRLLDEVEIDLQFAHAQRLDAGLPTGLSGGSVGEMGGTLRDLELDVVEREGAAWERLQGVRVSKATVRLAQAEAARASGTLFPPNSYPIIIA